MAVFEAMEDNLRATLAVFGRANEAGESRELSGVAVTSAGVQFSMFNSAILTAPVATPLELEHRIRTAGEFFAERELAWSFWICQDWIAGEMRKKVSIVFDRNRLHLVVELPGMAADRLELPQRALPRLTIRRVSDLETRADFNHIMSVAFGIPLPISRAVYEAERTWTGDLIGYVGYEDGLPISSAATVVTGNAVGVYAVATLPHHQHRGYGETIMRHALDQVHAAAGIECALLQSSEAGYSLYRKMGFRTVTRYAVFAT